jgi:hypothetical protein
MRASSFPRLLMLAGLQRELEIEQQLAALVTANNAQSSDAARERLNGLRNELRRLRSPSPGEEGRGEGGRESEMPLSAEEFAKHLNENAEG